MNFGISNLKSEGSAVVRPGLCGALDVVPAAEAAGYWKPPRWGCGQVIKVYGARWGWLSSITVYGSAGGAAVGKRRRMEARLGCGRVDKLSASK